MKTSYVSIPPSLFSVEEVSTFDRAHVKVEGGCDRCQHCFLVRTIFLQQRVQHHAIVADQGRRCIASERKEQDDAAN